LVPGINIEGALAVSTEKWRTCRWARVVGSGSNGPPGGHKLAEQLGLQQQSGG